MREDYYTRIKRNQSLQHLRILWSLRPFSCVSLGPTAHTTSLKRNRCCWSRSHQRDRTLQNLTEHEDPSVWTLESQRQKPTRERQTEDRHRARPVSLSVSIMDVCVRRLLLLCVFCVFSVSVCSGACAEVDSDTEAVAGEKFKLGCISCKVRGEVEATATVDWHFRARGEDEFTHIYTYDGEGSNIIDDRFLGRMEWQGSRKTFDLQDASVDILNVTFNDSGVYRCVFNRILTYEHYEFSTSPSKEFHLTVVAKATRGTASIVSEVMMYVTIIGLQLWLLVEMIYCYRKISAAGEEALRASAAEYLAIASEGKDNCGGVQVAE